MFHRRQLDKKIQIREIKIRGERFDDIVIFIPFDREGLGLVLPTNAVEVHDTRKFPLTLVRKLGKLVLDGFKIGHLRDIKLCRQNLFP